MSAHRAVVVYGPRGSGKSTHAKALAQHFGKSRIVDAFESDSPGQIVKSDTLVLAYSPVDGVKSVHILDACLAAGLAPHPTLLRQTGREAELGYAFANAPATRGVIDVPTSDVEPGEGELLPCPFCGNALDVRRRKSNPYARCATEGCKGKQLPLLNLDLPDDIAAWNRRAVHPSTSAQGL